MIKVENGEVTLSGTRDELFLEVCDVLSCIIQDFTYEVSMNCSDGIPTPDLFDSGRLVVSTTEGFDNISFEGIGSISVEVSYDKS